MKHTSNRFSEVFGFCKISKRFAIRAILNVCNRPQIKDCFVEAFISIFGLEDKKISGDQQFEQLFEHLKNELAEIEELPLQLPARSGLTKNLQWIKQKFKMNDVEQQLLLFFILIRQTENLRTALIPLGDLSTSKLINALKIILNVKEFQIKNAMLPDSKLVTSGLVNFSNINVTDIIEKVTIAPGLSSQMLSYQSDPFKLFCNNFNLCRPAKLDISDFPHLATEVSYIRSFLKQSIVEKKEGVNILLYGEPGTGKTEFTKMIAALIGCELFEVASEYKSSEPIPPEMRIQSYVLAQRILKTIQANKIIMFDEVEDIFGGRDYDRPKNGSNAETGGKLWMNKLLESNGLPTFWITNNIDQIDKAHLRRFDFHLEMKVPPKEVRLKIINQYTSELQVSDSWRSSVADNVDLAPAVIERSNNVVKAILKQNSKINAEEAMMKVMQNSLEAMGKSVSFIGNKQEIYYRLDALNANLDLNGLLAGLEQHPHARLCLHGSPGTGKTAFANQLAKRLNTSLITKRASDIVSPYVGQTERNMANLFNEAKSESAVLVLDEVDSFLRDRGAAQRSWEVSAVNEILVQMENFSGIFVASTNSMQDLDSAALRRFDFKIEFGYLKMHQAIILLNDLAKQLGISLSETELQKVKHLTMLTPGDFANVSRQAKIMSISSGSDIIQRLEDECMAKPNFSLKVYGFTH